ncbi:MAG: hypothetical protein JO317_00665, partial [Verrucomicrobiae bacterium]|nr:hypothetical protein [Verrucomicrobiae bacterium]
MRRAATTVLLFFLCVSQAVAAGKTPGNLNLLNPIRPPVDLPFRLSWSTASNAVLYELADSATGDFANASSLWTSAIWLMIPAHAPGTYSFRVRGWTAAPADGGRAGPWSNTLTVQVLNDDQFLDQVSRKSFDFLKAATNSNGLTRDRASSSLGGSNVESIAASGFYLSAITVAVDRGWISWTEGYNRATTTMRTFLYTTPNVHGFYYHFLKPDGSPSSVPFLEVSSIDTALLMAGALQSGEYFGGDAKTMADALYRRVEWTWMLDPGSLMMRQAWTSAEGFKGYYSSFCEDLLLYLLAIGSPTSPIPPDSLYCVVRPKGWYGANRFIFTGGGQLFAYQYPLIWFDLRNTADWLGVNWWNNAAQAVAVNRAFCQANPGYGYGPNLWGLTACDGPNGYKAYGAQLAYWNEHDGTIAPTAA